MSFFERRQFKSQHEVWCSRWEWPVNALPRSWRCSILPSWIIWKLWSLKVWHPMCKCILWGLQRCSVIFKDINNTPSVWDFLINSACWSRENSKTLEGQCPGLLVMSPWRPWDNSLKKKIVLWCILPWLMAPFMSSEENCRFKKKKHPQSAKRKMIRCGWVYIHTRLLWLLAAYYVCLHCWVVEGCFYTLVRKYAFVFMKNLQLSRRAELMCFVLFLLSLCFFKRRLDSCWNYENAVSEKQNLTIDIPIGFQLRTSWFRRGRSFWRWEWSS